MRPERQHVFCRRLLHDGIKLHVIVIWNHGAGESSMNGAFKRENPIGFQMRDLMIFDDF